MTAIRPRGIGISKTMDSVTGELILIHQEAPANGLENMRLDGELLQQAEQIESPLTFLRFYRWSEPTISLGKHQQAERALDLDACREQGIPVVQRPTGGRAVLHQDELTYAVVSNAPGLARGRDVTATYERIAKALFRGFNHLGIESHLALEGRSPKPRRDLVSPCFVTASRLELTWCGRKLAGSAQRRLARAFLQHGSIPLTCDYPLMGRVFGTPVELLRSTIASLSEALGKRPDFGQVQDALLLGFEEFWSDKAVALEASSRRELVNGTRPDAKSLYGIV